MKGYIQAQLSWAYRNKPVLPPNFDKDHYKGIGVEPSLEELRYKNPVTYVLKKNLEQNKEQDKERKKKDSKKKK